MIPVISIAIELLNIYPALTKSMTFIFNGYDSLPFDSPLKMIISFPFALTLGALGNGATQDMKNICTKSGSSLNEVTESWCVL
jgi:hypothetical protein